MSLRLLASIAAVLLLMFAAPPPARAGELTDAAGRHVRLPDTAYRVLPAERNAEVMVFVLAPDRLAGVSRGPGHAPVLRRRTVLEWRLRDGPATMAATAQRLGADLILDAGPVTPDRAAYADQVQQISGIPYVLLDDSFARMPRVLRTIGAIVGADARHTRDVWRFTEQALASMRGRLLITPGNHRPHVYYAIGPDGLTTALPGSPAGEALDEAGAINVAGALGRGSQAPVTPAQLGAWNPDIIIAEGPRAYAAFTRRSAWSHLAAVRNHKVFLEPTYPFGWIEDPSGVNRVIGLYWLSTLFYPDATEEDLRAVTCEFYDKFYRIKLTNAQLERMVRAAGVPPAQATMPAPEPLIGLGAAPPSTLPGTPGAAKAPGAPNAPSGALAQPAVPATPNPAATTCTLPGAANSPIDLPGAATTPGASSGSPALPQGVPPPGRRGRPSALLNHAPAPPPEAVASGTSRETTAMPAPAETAAAVRGTSPPDAVNIAVDNDGHLLIDGEIVAPADVTEALRKARLRRERQAQQ